LKIILVNQYFWPDWAATAQLLSDLGKAAAVRGFPVEALAGRGSYARADRQRLPWRETWQGVEIRRTWCTDFGRASSVGRLSDYGTYLLSAGLRVLFGKRARVVLCLSTPPLIGVLGLLARWRGSRFIYKVEDLYPDLAVALGVVREDSLAAGFLDWLSRRLLASADACVALDEAMGRALSARGASRVEVIPNWADGDAIHPDPAAGEQLRREWGLEDRLTVLYSGNLGKAHRFDAVCAAAGELAAERLPVTFLFAGAGPRLEEVRLATASLGNVLFLPYQPREDLQQLYNVADIHLVTLRDEVAGLLVPSKYPAALAAGKPVLLVGGSGTDLHSEIRARGLGWVRPHEAGAVAEALRAAIGDRGALAEMGRNARHVFEERYSGERAIGRWLELLQEVAQREDRPSEGSGE
jgi:glycosyltransferase involved in cell wall biosynthesis